MGKEVSQLPGDFAILFSELKQTANTAYFYSIYKSKLFQSNFPMVISCKPLGNLTKFLGRVSQGGSDE